MKLLEKVEKALRGDAGKKAQDEAIAVCIAILGRTKVVDCTDMSIESFSKINALVR